jgi:hypothetical protein
MDSYYKQLFLNEDFLDQYECNLLKNLILNNENLLLKHNVSDGDTELLPIKLGIDERLDIILNKINNIVLKNVDNKLKLYSSNVVKWKSGLEMPSHHDITKNSNIQYKFTTLCYLNEDYIGGETYLENSIEITPKTGLIFGFDGLHFKHGVKKIQSGYRYVLSNWYI